MDARRKLATAPRLVDAGGSQLAGAGARATAASSVHAGGGSRPGALRASRDSRHSLVAEPHGTKDGSVAARDPDEHTDSSDFTVGYAYRDSSGIAYGYDNRIDYGDGWDCDRDGNRHSAGHQWRGWKQWRGR